MSVQIQEPGADISVPNRDHFAGKLPSSPYIIRKHLHTLVTCAHGFFAISFREPLFPGSLLPGTSNWHLYCSRAGRTDTGTVLYMYSSTVGYYAEGLILEMPRFYTQFLSSPVDVAIREWQPLAKRLVVWGLCLSV